MKFSTKDYFAFTSHAAFGSSLRAWIKILAINKFAVHPYFLPKALFISTAIVLGIPFRWYERWKYDKQIKKQIIKQPIFILGHPRSGTTFIHYLLSKDPKFTYCTTTEAILPHLFLGASGILGPLIGKALPSVRPMDNLKMGSNQPKEEDFALVSFGPESLISGFYFPKNYSSLFHKHVIFDNNEKGKSRWKANFDYFLKKLSFAHNSKTLLLKSPANTGRVKEILEVYPDAKFIHIHRNPYEVYASNVHLFEKMLPILSFQKVKKAEITDAIIACYESMYKKFLKDRDLIPKENLVEIAYADFVNSPEQTLKSIYAQLSITGFEEAAPFIREELQVYKDYETNKFNLNSLPKAHIAERWKFAFEAFGYKI
mgnify:CR=1 FL=1